MGIGDTNLDHSLNIQDIIYAVNYVLNNNDGDTMFHLYKLDINLDYTINIIDIVELVNRILD